MRALLLSSMLMTLLACEDSTSPMVLPVNYYPLAVGNSWTYMTTHYDAQGNILQTMNSSFGFVDDTVIDGTTWYSYYADMSSLMSRKPDGYHVKQGAVEGLQWMNPSTSPQRYRLPSNPPLSPDSANYVEVSLNDLNEVLYIGVAQGKVRTRITFRENVGLTKVVAYSYTSSGEQYVEFVNDLVSWTVQ